MIGIDDPVAPWPHGAGTISMMNTAVPVTRDVHPMECHAFGIGFGGNQAINDLFISIWALVANKGIDFLQCRRQTCQVKSNAADKNFF